MKINHLEFFKEHLLLENTTKAWTDSLLEIHGNVPGADIFAIAVWNRFKQLYKQHPVSGKFKIDITTLRLPEDFWIKDGTISVMINDLQEKGTFYTDNVEIVDGKIENAKFAFYLLENQKKYWQRTLEILAAHEVTHAYSYLQRTVNRIDTISPEQTYRRVNKIYNEGKEIYSTLFSELNYILDKSEQSAWIGQLKTELENLDEDFDLQNGEDATEAVKQTQAYRQLNKAWKDFELITPTDPDYKEKATEQVEKAYRIIFQRELSYNQIIKQLRARLENYESKFNKTAAKLCNDVRWEREPDLGGPATGLKMPSMVEIILGRKNAG